MITLISAALGFLGSAMPEFLKLYQEKKDREHELVVMDRQIEQVAAGHSQRLEEVRIAEDSKQLASLYQTWKSNIAWVDALNGTVRPVLAYAFFLLYFAIKWMQFSMMDASAPLPWQIEALWNEEDQAIFAGIIAFYYGQRAMRKARG